MAANRSGLTQALGLAQNNRDPQVKNLLVSCLVIACFPAWADKSNPPTESEHEKFIRLTQTLEVRPLDPEAAEMRAWLIRWAEAAPDVSILACDILGPVPETQVPYGPELLGQYLFGNGAFQLKNPSSSDNVQKTQMAGVNSLLSAYQSILKADPGARIPHYDSWLDKQAAGALEAELAPVIQDECVASSPKA